MLVLLAILPLGSLFHQGLPLTHDGQDHVARIANFYQSLTEGIIVPRWGGNLNWGYGHPILMFLYPASSYFASAFHFLGLSLVDSVKLVFGVSYILSGVFMYLWIREYLGKYAGIIAAALYLYAPYRFVDLYVRGAIGEHVAFMFPPLVCYFFLKLSKKYTYLSFIGASISIGLLALSHNALLIMFLPFMLFYACYLAFISKKRISLMSWYILSFLLGFGLSAFFVVPAFLEGKYTLRDIVTGGEALKRFVDFKDLFYGAWSFGGTGLLSVQVGIVQWIIVLVSIYLAFFLYKKKNKDFPLVLFTLIYFLGSIFIMLPQSEFIWKTVTTLQKFQFPWRFLSVSVFSTAILGGFVILLIKKEQYKKMLVLAVVLILITSTFTYWHPKGYLDKSEEFFTSVYHGTTDTGESAPIWSVRFMEKTPKNSMEVIQGDASIREIKRKSTLHVYEIDSKYSSRIVESTLYFPGWNIYVNGKKYEGIQFQDPNFRGLMTFYVNNGKSRVEVRFEDTKIRTISNVVSVLSVMLLIAIGAIQKLKYKK